MTVLLLTGDQVRQHLLVSNYHLKTLIYYDYTFRTKYAHANSSFLLASNCLPQGWCCIHLLWSTCLRRSSVLENAEGEPLSRFREARVHCPRLPPPSQHLSFAVVGINGTPVDLDTTGCVSHFAIMFLSSRFGSL